MKDALQVALLLGGPSEEREVSLRSGQAMAAALRRRGHTVQEIDPVPGRLQIPETSGVVVIALHGTYGEDGTVQSELESLGMPFSGCDSKVSRLAFDKVATKEVLIQKGIATARYVVIRDVAAPLPGELSLPLVLKPVCQGSSVGLQFVRDAGEWSAALSESMQHGGTVLVEECIAGREVTVGILGDEALPVVEVRPLQGHYDYQNKYTAGATEYFCPADFEPSWTRRVQECGRAAFDALGCRDYARVDCIVRDDGTPVVLEVNTLPGMTETSLFPKAAAAAGMDYETLCERMLLLAINRSAGVTSSHSPHAP